MDTSSFSFLQIMWIYVYWTMSTFGAEGIVTKTVQVETGKRVKFPCPFRTTDKTQTLWFYSKTRDGNHTPYFPRRGRVYESLAYSDESVLVFNSVIPSDIGYYIYREVYPRMGTKPHEWCAYFLDILTPASVQCNPSQVAVEEFETVALSCTGSGSPIPQLHWYRKSIDGHSKDDMTVTGGSLTLYNVTRHASGVYVCGAVNSMGKSECDVNLSVEFLPEMDVFEEAILLTEPRDVTLMCRVTANPMPQTVIWTKGHSHDRIRENSRYGVFEDTELLKTHYTKYSLLMLKSHVLGETMFDEYWCRIPGFGKSFTAKVVVKDFCNPSVKQIGAGSDAESLGV